MKRKHSYSSGIDAGCLHTLTHVASTFTPNVPFCFDDPKNSESLDCNSTSLCSSLSHAEDNSPGALEVAEDVSSQTIEDFLHSYYFDAGSSNSNDDLTVGNESSSNASVGKKITPQRKLSRGIFEQKIDKKRECSPPRNPLTKLTREFLELREQNPSNEIMNLNDCASLLGVSKRRLYDITNVLEGINMLEKIGKNSIRWRRPADGSKSLDSCSIPTTSSRPFFNTLTMQDAENSCLSQKKYLQKLQEQENMLDLLLKNVTSTLAITKEDPGERIYHYVRISDLCSLDELKERTVIALQSDYKSISSVQVSNPVESERYEVSIRNNDRKPLKAVICPSPLHNKSENKSADHVIATNSNVNNGIRTQQHKKFTSSWLSPLKFLLSDFESELQYDEPQKPLASVFCGSSQVISSMKTPIMPSAMRCGPMSSLQCEVNRNPEREAGNGGSVLILDPPEPGLDYPLLDSGIQSDFATDETSLFSLFSDQS